ncbi:MAG: hypothetical protein JO328_21220 [Hyphomicrobiales bacterium]|nr:hypothetical protein [Hyphomicrobiales bacterium]MBV9429086.1 hypothetical protein [Bradyrhizobiaceae bacterium]
MAVAPNRRARFDERREICEHSGWLIYNNHRSGFYKTLFFREIDAGKHTDDACKYLIRLVFSRIF